MVVSVTLVRKAGIVESKSAEGTQLKGLVEGMLLVLLLFLLMASRSPYKPEMRDIIFLWRINDPKRI